MSRPDPSPVPVARISVTYDTNVDGAAEALLAILRHLPGREKSEPADAAEES